MSRLVLAIIALAVLAPAAQAAPKRADLSVSKVAVSSTALAQGAQLTVSWTVKNAGRASAGKSTTEVVLSTDAKLDRGDPRFGTGAQKAIKARKGANAKLTARVSAPARRWSVLVCADARKKVRESKETNNCRAVAVTVTAPPAPPATPQPSPPSPATPAPTVFPTAAPTATATATATPTATPTATATPDPDAPETTITSGPPDVTALDSAAFTFTSPTGTSFECRLGTDAFAPCTSPKAYTGVLAGERVFEVRARSARGTADPTPARKGWRIEFEGPAPGPDPPAAQAPEGKADAPQPGEMTLLGDSTKFLYTGADPIQKGVADGAIEALRAAVLRGKVTRRDGSPIPGVEVSVLDRPELGHTATRPDGGFDLAVNGGGFVTVAFKRTGYISSQRQLEVPTQDFETVEDVVLVPYDDRVTGVDFDDDELQVAQGAPITDGDGTRRATLLFEPGTEATATLPDGSTKELGDRLNIRATEFTIGESGPAAMPGELPPTSAYTYAVEYTVDEATEDEAVDVRFDKPVVTYVDNMLGFPAGTAVPMGYYDREQGRWVAADNGLVIKLVGEAGGRAQLDVTGDGVADSVTALGIDDAELVKLAQLYDAGKSLWRSAITHFTPWDYNWPYGLPDGADGPDGDGPDDGDPDGDDPCNESGSIILCESQVLGERSPISGTPYTLVYQSDRVPGRVSGDSLDVPLTKPTSPASIKRVDMTVEVAGRTTTQSFAPTLRTTSFVWNGKDAYGRFLQGRQKVDVTIDYVYDAVYRTPDSFRTSFAAVGGARLTANSTRTEIAVGRKWSSVVGDGLQQPAAAMAGWAVDVHHIYDPIGRTLYQGDGTKRSAEGQNFDTIATSETGLDAPEGMVVTEDGDQLIADSAAHVIRRVTRTGASTVIAGTGTAGFGGDGGDPLDAEFDHPSDIAVAPDGAIYVADQGNNRVRRIFEGRVTTIAGDDDVGYEGDGGPARDALLDEPSDVAVDGGGAVYVVDRGNHAVRRIGADGTIATLAGTGAPGFGGDGGVATSARLRSPRDVVVARDGAVFIADGGNDRVRRIDADGRIETIAGGGNGGDGSQATTARLDTPTAIAPLRDGGVMIADAGHAKLRKVSPDGRLLTVAGTGTAGVRGDGGAAPRAQIDLPQALALGADDTIYMLDGGTDRVRAIAPTLPGLDLGEFTIASLDGRSLYVFDATGRHLRTVDALTKGTVLTFGYDTAGRLTSITDGDGRVTRFERTNGVPAKIVGPDQHETSLAVTNGYLSEIVNPAGDKIALEYDGGGLLTKLTDPLNGAHRFEYDGAGRLTKDTAPDNTFQTLTRDVQGKVTTVTLRTGEGRTKTYRTERTGDETIKRTITDGEGLSTVTLAGADGTSTTTRPDGTKIVLEVAPDPRFGMQSPLAQRMTLTTPGGRRTVVQRERIADLATPGAPLSLRSLTERTIVNGRAQTMRFDAAARTFTDTSAEGRTSETLVDELARPLRVSSPGVTPTVNTYDAAGRRKTTTQGPDRSETLTYDGRGRVQTITDALDRVTSYTYDLADRPLTQTLPGGHVVAFTHDRNGNLTSLTPPGKPKYDLAYSTRSLLETFTAPGPSATTYASDKDEFVTQVVRPGNQVLGFTYDGAGRVKTSTQPGRTTTYAYAPETGNLTSVAAGGERVEYGYDGVLLTRATVSGAAPGVIESAYDDELRLASETIGGESVTRDYDDDGLPIAIGDLELEHDPGNGLLDTLGAGGSATTIGRNTEGEPESLVTRQGAAASYREDYERDDLGRITVKTETRPNGTTTAWDYDFDDAGRLERVRFNDADSAVYEYDANGNRTKVTRGATTVTSTYDDQDRLLSSDNGTTYAYTASGALRTKTVGAATTTYDYDATGALTGVTLPGGAQLGYTVDAGGRRVAETGGASQRRFLYGRGLGPMAELNATGTGVKSRFIYATHSNVPDLMIRGGKTYRIVTNQLGSPMAVVDVATGDLVQELDYDEFGRVTRDTNPEFQPFGFAGGLWDRETGLVRFGARDYDPETGRFTAPDPAGFAGGSTNLYGYALNDPVNITDPSGQVLDTILDLGFIAYDLYRIGKSLMNGCGVSAIDAAALGLDIAAAFIPFATGGGAAARRVNEGIYRIDTPDGPYIGQSNNIDRRMTEHARDPRFTQEQLDAASRTEVMGGKTQREIAEQRAIDHATDGVGASSDKVLNKVNPIGPKRRHLMDE